MISDLFHFLVEIFFSNFFYIKQCPNLVHITETSGCSGSLPWGETVYSYLLILHPQLSCKMVWSSGLMEEGSWNTKELSSSTVRAIGCIQTHGCSLAARKWLLIILASLQSFGSGLIQGPQKMFCSKEQSERAPGFTDWAVKFLYPKIIVTLLHILSRINLLGGQL